MLIFPSSVYLILLTKSHHFSGVHAAFLKCPLIHMRMTSQLKSLKESFDTEIMKKLIIFNTGSK